MESYQKKVVFCDARTAGLFDPHQYEIVDQRQRWGDMLREYGTVTVDPTVATLSLRDLLEGYGLVVSSAPSSVTAERRLKKPHEKALIATSQRLNKQVYDMIQSCCIPGATELSIAREIQICQLQLGADGPSFPPIVAFGPHTAIPHHSPTERVLQQGDAVLIDMGLIWQGYCSDMTRCFVCGCGAELSSTTNPNHQLIDIGPLKWEQGNSGTRSNSHIFHEIYSLLQTVTHEIIAWAKPGMRVAELDAKAREMLGVYAPYFTHSLGHGVGIDIHEKPFLSSKSEDILLPGMVVTIEPGIYITAPDDRARFGLSEPIGARYEEMVLVDKDGLLLL